MREGSTHARVLKSRLTYARLLKGHLAQRQEELRQRARRKVGCLARVGPEVVPQLQVFFRRLHLVKEAVGLLAGAGATEALDDLAAHGPGLVLHLIAEHKVSATCDQEYTQQTNEAKSRKYRRNLIVRWHCTTLLDRKVAASKESMAACRSAGLALFALFCIELRTLGSFRS
jgi:hypothetical protein